MTVILDMAVVSSNAFIVPEGTIQLKIGQIKRFGAQAKIRFQIMPPVTFIKAKHFSFRFSRYMRIVNYKITKRAS